jgi:RNA-directed DNA polymerase
LYLIPVPLKKNSSQTAIEDLFPDEVRQTKVEGKSFKPNAKGHQTDGYGKVVFAHKVVRPLADKIDFSGFSPLLTVIASAIADFATKQKALPPTKPN